MAPGAGGLGGGVPPGGGGVTGSGGGACTGPVEVLALGAGVEERVGTLVRGGAGAGCFPLDTGGVGNELVARVCACAGDGKLPGSALACWAGEPGVASYARVTPPQEGITREFTKSPKPGPQEKL